MSDSSSPTLSAPTCPDCATLRARLEEALLKIDELQAQLNLLLGRNSSNSSSPPSADPPGAPKPKPKPPTGRKPGGQPGHQGHHRQRLPNPQHVVVHCPSTCSQCQAPLPQEPSPADPEPTWHQVVEAPPILAVVTEHQGHARTCPDCGHLNRAEIPPEVRSHVVGPRLAAIMSCLSGCYHLSRRHVQEVVETVFGAPVSLGRVATLEQQTAAALEGAHRQARETLEAAPAKNVDETGWSQAGRLCWLWTAATASVVFFLIHSRRGRDALEDLLGAAALGIVVSDRWSAYNWLPLEQRQICWAHLKRDFQKLIDGGGAGRSLGEAGAAVVTCLFHDWGEFREGKIDRIELVRRVDRIAKELREELERARGDASQAKRTRTFCGNLLKLEPALWLFAKVAGVEPTNNHAERMLRPGVLWRKNAFGSQSEGGCRFAERMLTVVGTLRLQERSVLEYLSQAVDAHRAGRPGLQLVGQSPG